MTPWKLVYAARFVAKWEGYSADAYWDSLGRVWTIGYGHTSGVHQGQHITKAKALALLTADLRSASKEVKRLVKVKLTTRQRIALISFVFNLGGGSLETSELLDYLNAGNYKRAANEFLKWDHAGGVKVLGLTRRRRAERWLFLHSRRR